jgi:uncharacterized protein
MKKETLERLRSAARRACDPHGPAHDFAHVERVHDLARQIARSEGGDLEVVTGAALLHDLFQYRKDHPLAPRSSERAAEEARKLLAESGFPEAKIEPVCACIREHSYSAGAEPSSLEAAILQDADRLDAMGAIGVARWAATCGETRRPFYAPQDPLCRERIPDDLTYGFDHFPRKLLRLQMGIHTRAGKRLAEDRATFLRAFFDQFGKELGEFESDPAGNLVDPRGD